MANLKSATDLYSISMGNNSGGGSLPKQFDINTHERTIQHFIFEREKPKLKYLYKLYCEPIDYVFGKEAGCYVKSIDKPKIDIEFVEQVRNNVVRYYPVKYSYPEVSIVYYDSGDSIVTFRLMNMINNIFSVSDDGTGFGLFAGRGAMASNGHKIVVEQIATHLGEQRVSDGLYGKTNTYMVKNPDSLKYVFYNVQVTSIDGDQFDSDDDSGYLIYTLTFKYEYFDWEPGS